MLFLASSITQITMDSKWYFPSFAADATDLYPRPKCHPAWVASPPPCGSWARTEDGRGFFVISNWQASQEETAAESGPPWSRYYKEEALLLLLLRTYSYIQIGATSTGHAAGFLSSVLCPQFPMVYYSSLQELCVSARASAHVRMTEGVAVPVRLHRSRDTSVQATEHEYLYMAPRGSFDEPFAACVCLISTGGTASSSLHAAF
ncbi:hypothetical protein J3F84DRAFT_307381 [Trichoderma pleuroticola]